MGGQGNRQFEQRIAKPVFRPPLSFGSRRGERSFISHSPLPPFPQPLCLLSVLLGRRVELRVFLCELRGLGQLEQSLLRIWCYGYGYDTSYYGNGYAYDYDYGYPATGSSGYYAAAPLVTGRSVAARQLGSYCTISVKACELHHAGGACYCRVPGGRGAVAH